MKHVGKFVAFGGLLLAVGCGNTQPAAQQAPATKANLIFGKIDDASAKAGEFDGKWENCAWQARMESPNNRRQVITIDRGYAKIETYYYNESDCSGKVAATDPVRFEKWVPVSDSFLVLGGKRIDAIDVDTKAKRPEFAVISKEKDGSDRLDISSPRFFPGDKLQLDNEGYPYYIQPVFKFHRVTPAK